jgi:hypothetical protein
MRRGAGMRAVAALALTLAGGPGAAQEPLSVLATVGMVADVAQAVGGDCVAVEAMIGPGSDPHLYQPTASDVGRLQRAGSSSTSATRSRGSSARCSRVFRNGRPPWRSPRPECRPRR